MHRYAETTLPTARGPMRLVVYREGPGDDAREHVALVFGDPARAADELLVRVHSECITSEVFGSLKCDCKEQLEAALDRCHRAGDGVVVYLRQEGRGIGLGNKIRAYRLQESGLDTVDANHELGFGTDLRRYGVAAAILRDLGARGVCLMTNNPDKVAQLEQAGLRVVRRVPHEIHATAHNEDYLRAKMARCGHMLELLPAVPE